MISEEDLFEIFSDSHFMQTHRISADDINDLVTLAMVDLTNDYQFQNLVMQQARIEDSISTFVGDVINNIVKPQAQKPASESQVSWYEITSAEESLNYLTGSN